MGLLLLPKQYHPDFRDPRLKPVNPVALDSNNPLVASLLDSWDFINSYELNLARQNNLVLESNTLKSVAKGQTGLDFNVGSFNAAAVGHQLVRFSHEVCFVVNDATSSNISSIAESPGNSTHDRDLYIASSGAFTFSIFDGATKQASSTTIAATGDIVHLVGTSDGVNIKIYVDGVLEATTAAGDAFTGFATPEFIIGEGFDGVSAGSFSDNYVFYHRIYTRALIAAEVFNLNRDRYQHIKPANEPLYIVPSVAVAGRIMSSLASSGGLAGMGGIAGQGGGLAG